MRGWMMIAGMAALAAAPAGAAEVTVHRGIPDPVARHVPASPPAFAPAGSLGWLPGDGYRYLPPVDWRGGRIEDDGQALLDPWLRETREGRRFVTWGYDADRNGIIDRATAFRANRDFAEMADRDGDGYLDDREIGFGLEVIGSGNP